MKDTWSVMANPTHREIQQMLQKRDMTAGGERQCIPYKRDSRVSCKKYAEERSRMRLCCYAFSGVAYILSPYGAFTPPAFCLILPPHCNLSIITSPSGSFVYRPIKY